MVNELTVGKVEQLTNDAIDVITERKIAVDSLDATIARQERSVLWLYFKKHQAWFRAKLKEQGIDIVRKNT